MTASTRRLSTTAGALAIACLSFVMLANQASTQTAASFRDDFSSISYSGNNGTENWSGSWQESGESDGPATGNVRVIASDRCLGGSGNCMRIGSDGGNLSNHGVSRAANLDDAVSATLSFHYRRQTQGQVSGSVTVQVSGNGGSSWTTLTTINFAGPQKASNATFNIGGYMGPNTKARFRGTGSGVNGYLHFDAIEITADIAPPITTTTVVTTTVPGTPTTTTTPGTPTTTIPGTPTTTTTPGTPTTTAPGSPTTTTIPGATPSTTAASVTATNPTATSTGTASTTTSSAGGDAAMSEAPGEATVGATEAAGQSPDELPTSDDLPPMAIAVEAVSANAATLAILALVASGLAIAGIDRTKLEQTTDGAVDPESLDSDK
jgi:hypothetical protein